MDARNAGASRAAEMQDREIVITRAFDAPRELVFKAWTDPQHLAHWWGPDGFTTRIQEMDVRPGGAWNLIMRGPDGTDYPNHSIFTEVVKNERLAYSHGGGKEGGTPADFHATVTFEKDGEKTRVTLRMLFKSAALRNQIATEYGAIEGGKQTFARLAEHLRKMDSAAATASGEFAITRVFDAPRDLVFNALTDPERLSQWWGPKGFTWVSCKMDLRPGGVFHYCMRSPEGHEMWGKFVYREIVAPERIVFVNSFSDKDARITGHPMSPTWPAEVLNTLTLTEHEGKTTVHLRGGPIDATEEERNTFEAGFESMQKGFGGTFDQLAEYLAKA